MLSVGRLIHGLCARLYVPTLKVTELGRAVAGGVLAQC